MSFKTLALMCITPILVFAANDETSVQLQFEKKTPVQLTSTHDITFDQSVLGMKMAFKGSQVVNSILELESDNNGSLPFNLVLTPKEISLNFSINDRKFNFNSRDPNRNLIAAELSKWIDKSVSVTIDPSLKLRHQSEQMDALIKKYPTLGELNPYGMLEGLLLPVLALKDVPLTRGKVVNRENVKGDFGVALSSIDYEITDITDKEVIAKYKGVIAPHESVLGDILNTGEIQDSLPMKIVIEGKVEGKARWNRQNALICQITGAYDYHAVLKMGGLEWPIDAIINSELSSKAVPAPTPEKEKVLTGQ